ncbi:GMC family oxidoreductase [Pseudomonas silvicola]|uniref:GMC family oxidoreductase n=1 Tax=Pseudomonas sp. RIT-To-2 TaxID=3462541 RepID=UPI00227C4799|nr:GMC family oxidoreductase [Pseudomonas silvicola]
MANARPKADVVVIGLGWSGSVIAEELARAGLKVVAIERGAWRDTATDFPPSVDTDELRWATRKEILQPPKLETYTFRNNATQQALPVREWSNLTLGYNVGGAGTHWAAASWRFNPFDFQPYSKTVERYGKQQLVPGLQVQDWGITYDELEPFYDRFERIAGTSGQAGVINGKIIPGGNPFEGSRSRDFPTPPLVPSRWNDIFTQKTTELGYHPFPVPAGTISRAYVNALGVHMGPCTYCGYCQLFGCGNWSKSSPNACVVPALMRQPTFEVMTETEVLHINKAPDGKTATGVSFVGKDGVVGEQPADIVIVAAYQLDNVRLMLLSGIGEPYDPRTKRGVIGRNYSFQTLSYAYLWFENEYLNPFINTGCLAIQIDDFNADNFDHSGLGFIGGAGIQSLSNNGLPIGMAGVLPKGAPAWGKGWKQSFQHSYQNWAMVQGQGTSYSHEDAYFDLDPVYKDNFGRPLMRMTFDYNLNDKRSGEFVRQKCEAIAKAVGGTQVESYNFAADHYTPFRANDSSHTIGGVVMGTDPKTSALNRYQQSWDVHNVFVLGASSFPNNGGFNPTVTIGALALWTAKAIKEQYVKNPGPLVQA